MEEAARAMQGCISATNRAATRLITCLLLAALLPAGAQAAAGDEPEEEYVFSAVLPLGLDCVQLGPEGRRVHIMVSAMAEGMAGMRRLGDRREQRLLSAAGVPLEYLPRRVEFRITATALRDHFAFVGPHVLETTEDLNPFLMGLRFRVRIFHGLDSYTVRPLAVRLLGMPADVPYEERIYSALFDLGQVPLDRRLVLEIFSAGGERVGRFHLEYFF